MMLSDWLGQPSVLPGHTNPVASKVPLHPVMPSLPGYPNPYASPNAAFQPGHNIGQLLMMLPHQGAGFMQGFPHEGMPYRGPKPGFSAYQ